MKLPSAFSFLAISLVLASCSEKDGKMNWAPASGPLTTQWTRQINPDNVLAEYPRPQMVRDKWLNLNGLWDYAVTRTDAGIPGAYQGEILVPFPLEAALSGVMKSLQPDELLWYHRTFKVPGNWRKNRILLHFGSIDWEAIVYLNGKKLTEHRGGYDPFSVDITDALNNSGIQDLVVRVWDPTDLGRTDTANAPRQPSGKQRSVPYGTEYSQVSGIWKTVWLEPVPAARIENYEAIPDIDQEVIRIKVSVTNNNDSYTLKASATDNGKWISTFIGKPGTELTLEIPDPKLWWPDDPFLYGLNLTLINGDKKADEVDGYFGMRKISVGQDSSGVTRILLNNRFVFQYGLLDQGYWPDGLYTAPTDSALVFDIKTMKELGFNVARKHGKVEPDRWYYWCDKLGLMVWQDMIPKFPAAGYGRNEIWTSPADAAQFELELKRMIYGLRNHPSVIVWTVFNETWGNTIPNALPNG